MPDHEVKIKVALQNLTQRGLSAVTRSLSGLKRHALSVGRSMGNAFLHPIQTLWKLKAALIPVTAGIIALGASIKKSFAFETTQLKFSILFRSMSKAKAHMKELAAFSDATPFTFKEIAAASKRLLTLTNNALGATDSLKLLGDAAAFAESEQPLQDLAMWVGRAYAAIKAGLPVGEATMRLLELGVITTDVKKQLDELSQSGANSERTWNILIAALRRFEGGMKELSHSGDGLISTLSSKWELAVKQFGDAFKKLAKDGLQKAIDLIDRLRNDGTIEKFANSAKNALESVLNIASALHNPQTRVTTMRNFKELVVSSFLLGSAKAGEMLKSFAPIIGKLIGESAQAAMFQDGADRRQATINLIQRGALEDSHRPRGHQYSWYESITPRLPSGRAGAEADKKIERLIAEEVARINQLHVDHNSPIIRTTEKRFEEALAAWLVMAKPKDINPSIFGEYSERPRFGGPPAAPFQDQRRPFAWRHMPLDKAMKRIFQSDDPALQPLKEKWQKMIWDSLTPKQQLSKLRNEYNILNRMPKTPERLERLFDIVSQGKALTKSIKEGMAENRSRMEQNIFERSGLYEQLSALKKPTKAETGIRQYFEWMRAVKKGRTPDEMLVSNTTRIAELLRQINQNIKEGGLY